MTNADRLIAAGWRPTSGRKCPWTRGDGDVWYTEDEALVVVLAAERDAAIARAERAECINATLQRDRDAVVAEGMRNYDAAVARAEAAEALAASRPEITPEDARDVDDISPKAFERIRAALRAHAAKVSR